MDNRSSKKRIVGNVKIKLYVHTMNNKTVTDILYVGVNHTPLSFNQISHKSKKYEGICPFCANEVGIVKASTYGDLALKLYDLQVKHIDNCVNKFETEIIVRIKRKHIN